MENKIKECIAKVEDFFKTDMKTMMRIIYFLNKEEHDWGSGETPVQDLLHFYIKKRDKNLLAEVMNNIADDTLKYKEDDTFKKMMYDLYQGLKKAEEYKPLSENWLMTIGENVANSSQDPKSYLALLRNISSSMALIPAKSWPTIVESLETNFVANSTNFTLAVKGATGITEKIGAGVAVVVLAAAQLSYAAIKSIYDWYHGKISGKRCGKQIVDSAVSIGGGIGGAYAGAALGGLLGPIGGLVGGVLGGVAGSNAAQTLSDHLTCMIFDLPKTAAVEKAYAYLGVSHKADNSKINSAFRKLSLQYHPDKPGGSTEKFYELQSFFQIIKEARQEG